MDGLLLSGGGLGHCLEFLGVLRREADLGQAVRQTDLGGELDEVLDLLRVGAFHDELGAGANVDLLAVGQAVGLLGGGKTVVDSVGCGKPAGLEAETGQESVSLDDCLECRGDHSGTNSIKCGETVLPQDVPAQLGQGGAGSGRVATVHRGAVALCCGAGLDPGGQGVTDAGDEEFDGCTGDELGVDEDDVGVLREEKTSCCAMGPTVGKTRDMRFCHAKYRRLVAVSLVGYRRLVAGGVVFFGFFLGPGTGAREGDDVVFVAS